MRFPSKVLFAALGAALIGSIGAAASATIVVLVTREELVSKSSVVARVTVGRAQTGESDDGSAIVTRTEVVTKDCLKGPCPAKLSIEQLGGRYNGKTQRVLGDGALRPGEDAIVFLTAGDKGVAYLTALALSVYHVDATGFARRDLDGLTLMQRRSGKLEALDTPAEQPVKAEDLAADVVRIAKGK